MKKMRHLKENDETDAFDIETLRDRLIEEDNFISTLIDTIPSKYYFDNDVQEQMIAEKHATMDEAAKGIKRSFPQIQELSAKNKHKRARLDPQQFKLVSEIQQEMERGKTPRAKKGAVTSSATLTRAANVQELQRRIKERIQELQGKRRGCSEEDFLEKKRLKRKMRRVKKRQKGNMKKPVTNDQQSTENKNKKSPKQKMVKEITKPVYNKDGKIIYSKFDFSENGEKLFDKKKKKRGGKNLKKMIENVEKGQQKIETVKETDPMKANELMQKNAWHRAIQKAEGVKLKDDPTLLKKSLKKHEKEKSKSSKEWKKRLDHTDKKVKARQEKRKKNIQARKKEKLDKKIKKAKKKGRLIPGF